MVWSIIGWFFLGLLALLILLLVLPVTIRISFAGGQLGVRVRVLFLRLTIIPAKPRKPKKEKPKKEKKPRAEAPQDEQSKKEKPKKTLSQKIRLIKRLVKAGLAALRLFLRHLRITGVQLALPVHAEDAADTAKRCGQVQIAVGTLRALLDGRLHVRCKRLEVIPDYAGQMGDALYFSCKLVLCPGIIIPMGVVFLVKFLQSRRPYSRAAYKRAVAQKRAGARQAPNTHSGPGNAA